MRKWQSMTTRSGFSLLELLIVLAMAAIVTAMAAPSLARSMAATKLQRAANVIAADLQLAHSTAARARQPVQVSVDASGKLMRVRSYPTTTTMYSERWFNTTSEYPVQAMTVSTANIVLYPNGLGSSDITITLTAAGRTRVVTMNRTGQVRITE
jgi:type II secretion system protein H